LFDFIYNPEIGLLNQLLEAVGLDELTRAWLGEKGDHFLTSLSSSTAARIKPPPTWKISDMTAYSTFLFHDPVFFTALRNNVLYAVISLIFQVGGGLILAAVLGPGQFIKSDGFQQLIQKPDFRVINKIKQQRNDGHGNDGWAMKTPLCCLSFLCLNGSLSVTSPCCTLSRFRVSKARFPGYK
jgi:ABC-type sugar transport system permease subunit